MQMVMKTDNATIKVE